MAQFFMNNFFRYKWNGFWRRCFLPILELSYFFGTEILIEFGVHISPRNQPIVKLQSRKTPR